MSSQNQTAWKCDRCGATATTPFRGSSPWTTTATGRKPTGWGRVTIHFFGMREAEDMDLCNPCDVRCHGHVKGTDDSRLLENFWQLAMDYFDRPPGASGNRERADKARFALDLLTRYEDDPTPWYAAGSHPLDDPYPPLLPDEDQFPTSSEHQESSE